jgi:hypothetical protein
MLPAKASPQPAVWVTEAIDAKIEDQVEFVADEKVRGAHRPRTNADPALLTREQAQDQTGVPPAAGLPLAEEPQGQAEIPREAEERKKPPAILTQGANFLADL